MRRRLSFLGGAGVGVKVDVEEVLGTPNPPNAPNTPNPAGVVEVVGLVKSRRTAVTTVAFCIISRYAAPLRARISSSSASVMARYAYCNEDVINCVNKSIMVSNNAVCPHSCASLIRRVSWSVFAVAVPPSAELVLAVF